jgi:hypothetical protein
MSFVKERSVFTLSRADIFSISKPICGMNSIIGDH